MNDLNQKIKAHIDVLIQQFKETPKHQHYKKILGIERQELKVNQSEEDALLYEDIIQLRFKEVLCEGVNDEIRAKDFSKFDFKDSYESESWEFAEDYVTFCLEKFLLEEKDLVLMLWQERFEAFVGTDIVKRKRIKESDYSVPNHIKDYILKSLNGPEILYKLTFNDKLIKTLNEKTVTESLEVIADFENHNFLVITDTRVDKQETQFVNTSRIFTGLSRVSTVFWGLISVISVIGFYTDSGMELSSKLLYLILIFALCYVSHRVTVWILDGFTNPNR